LYFGIKKYLNKNKIINPFVELDVIFSKKKYKHFFENWAWGSSSTRSYGNSYGLGPALSFGLETKIFHGFKFTLSGKLDYIFLRNYDHNSNLNAPYIYSKINSVDILGSAVIGVNYRF
jgi:hypothetical protein